MQPFCSVAFLKNLSNVNTYLSVTTCYCVFMFEYNFNKDLIKLLSLVGLFVFLLSGDVVSNIDKKTVPSNLKKITYSFAPLVKQAAPAVVNIFTRKAVKRQIPPLFVDPFFRKFFGQAFPDMNRERIERSLGSGVIVKSDGFIVTNYHVIAGADAIKVVLNDRREFSAVIIREDQRSDLAVLKIEPDENKFPYIEIGNSDNIEVGDLVIAIGNPFGVGQTVTSGIVSGLARTKVGISDFNFFIQTDAAINPGNSGGALLSMDGKLAGVNTAIFSRSGGSQGIGFAVPGNMVRSVVFGADRTGKLQRPWLGANIQSVTQKIAQTIGLDRPAGTLITELHHLGPAIRSGLVVGDVVTRIDGHKVYDTESLLFRIATSRVGEIAKLSVVRGKDILTLPLLLESPPEIPPRQETLLKGQQPVSGVTVVNLSPAVAEERGLNQFATGVIIIEVESRSPAARIGFRSGDIILQINSTRIVSVPDLVKSTRSIPKTWHLVINRKGQRLTMTVSG